VTRSPDRLASSLVAAGWTLLVISLVRTAWLSDDGYITFRTADNIIHGYGPVWNTAERVQTYTHPLWLALITPAFAMTHEVYYTAIAISMGVTLAAVALLARRLAATPWNLVVCLAALLSSKAFIDFSTSGLENPLTHLLVFVFVWLWWDEPDSARRTRRLSFVAGLCLLNRLDLAPLVAPALAYEAWRRGLRTAIRPVLVGLAPLIAWELFSTFYYGTPLPNTAYAKLNTVLTADARMRHGVNYLLRTLTGDPATLPVVIASLFAIPLSRYRRDWPLVAGIALFSFYVLRVGGDWMMGRFLTPALAMAIALLARAPWLEARGPGLAAAAAVVVGGLFATWEPAILSGYGFSYANNLVHGRTSQRPMDDETKTFLLGVMDERRYYYEATGLLKTFRAQPRPHYEWSVEGLRLHDGGGHVVVHINIGMLGYFAGPRVHVIDLLGLGDPLLARIPGGFTDSPMGHFPRRLPDGYVDSIETGENRLTDPDLKQYYDRLHLVIAGPLWSGRRIATLVQLLAGRYDDLLARYVSRQRQR
jgi:arabinofuranosyltransferase